MTVNPVTGFDFPLISTDGHIQPPLDAWTEELPPHLRELAPHEIEINGEAYREIPGLAPMSVEYLTRINLGTTSNPMEALKEFRADIDGGRNLETRKNCLALDGVWGEVVFPNYLGLSTHPNPEFQRTLDVMYNDMCADIFLAHDSNRFAPAAQLSTVCVDDAVAEAKRVKDLGFVGVMLPPVVPWMPYWHRDWDPLWATLQELHLVLNFHTFSGNTAEGADFGSFWVIPPELEEIGRARLSGDRVAERLSTTVMGMAAAMSPMTHLIGSGTLDRFPTLRFALVESEAGWIPWTLQTLDAMQRRRRFAMITLELKPSDYFRRQGWATFIEDEVAIATLEYIGEDRLMWSNDFPHDEGTFGESQRVIGSIIGRLPYEVKRKLLHDNAAKLYGLDCDSVEPEIVHS